MIKKGQILKYKDGSERKVLAALDDVYLLSPDYNFNITGGWYTQKEIEENFILPEETWEPGLEEKYWYITNDGNVNWSSWDNDHVDNARKNFLGVFKSKKDAQKRLDEIKSKI